MDPATLSLGETCDFTAAATLDGKPLDSADLTWEWDFGDKSDLSKENPAPHAYTAPGEYLVTVAAFCEKQSTSAKVKVIVEGIMLDGPTDGPGIIIFTPDVSGEVCDTGAVLCAIPMSWINANPSKTYAGARFYRIINGQRVRQDEAGDGWVSVDTQPFTWDNVQYKVSRLASWFTQSLPNVSTTWEADYSIGTPSPPPPGRIVYTTYTTPQRSITPNNSVVTSATDPLILHTENPQSHPIEWDVAHLDYPTTPQHIQFTVTVNVYDLSGGTVWTWQGIRDGPGGGSTTWPGTVTGGGSAAKGIYTFKVTATHSENMGCGDQDKVDSLGNVSATHFIWVTYPTRAEVILHYTIIESLVNCVLTAYKPDLSDTTVYVPGGVLSGTVETHDVRTEFEVDPQVCGTYRFVITGDQASGAGNRDLQPKPTVPEGASVDIWPPAVAVKGNGLTFIVDQLFPDVVTNLGLADSATNTVYAAYVGGSTALATREAMRTAAIVYITGHGNPYEMQINYVPPGLLGTLSSQSDPDDPAKDYYHIPQFGYSLPALFVLYNGCNTWSAQGSPAPPDGLQSRTRHQGAENTAGFEGLVQELQGEYFAKRFFYYSMGMGESIGWSNLHALTDVVSWLLLPGGVETFHAHDYTQTLKPARWR